MVNMELAQRLKYRVCTEISGKRILTSCTIFNMLGKGVTGMLNKDNKALLKACTQICNDYYPETAGHLFVVNAPMIFAGVWSVAKGFLDEKTRSKVKILGTNYLSTLEEFVVIDELPTFLGGKCTCNGFPGGCLAREPGPWDDYEIYQNTIRRKRNIDGPPEDRSQQNSASIIVTSESDKYNASSPDDTGIPELPAVNGDAILIQKYRQGKIEEEVKTD